MDHTQIMGQSASFFELWSPLLILFLSVVGLLYYRLVGSWRESFANSEPVSTKTKAAFYTGLILVYIAQGSPLDYIGHHYMFSIHMLQQSILYLIAPIYIITGMPSWALEPVLKVRWVHLIVKFFTSPIIAVLLFNLLFSVYHLPLVMDFVMMNELARFAYHSVLLFTAFTMWFPVFTTIPDYGSMTGVKKMGYIFVNGVLLTPACALIIFAETPMYAMYKDVVLPFEFLPVLDDQQLGGVVMKIMQELSYGFVLFIIFRKWYNSERAHDTELSDEPREGVEYKHTFEPVKS
ncbi:cytochrome c oxidase assembly protein [Paenibacillus sp. N1-5-1-14]|uniref:cytochrome c oxidase assembly protein n=1 Tax=Paenibacillus radicibacter TaxID=2972488 RepID=UPI0021599C01|nr:cytochrome c oxidase assembly protein [Paenibacillus radicibacter]MCR8643190.1 cytochrome c oxidase assembly protein [Paenibacillus radicibacter]